MHLYRIRISHLAFEKDMYARAMQAWWKSLAQQSTLVQEARRGNSNSSCKESNEKQQ